MERMIAETFAMGIGGALVLFCIAYRVIMHETRARIYRTRRLDNWDDKE